MTNYTSLSPPDSPVSGPPDPIKAVGTVLSILLSLALAGFIIFLCIEFVLDHIGSPIRREPVSVAPNHFSDEEQLLSRKRIFTAEEIQSQFRIVTPPNFARIEEKWITVLCRWTPPGAGYEEPPVRPQLFVDESLVPWTMQFGSGTWFARIATEGGEHRLRVLDQERIVYVAESFPPHEKLTIHEGTDDPTRCGECHVIIAGKNDIVHQSRALTVGPLLSFDVCFVCHTTDTVQLRHSKLTEATDNCMACHRLHGVSKTDRRP